MSEKIQNIDPASNPLAIRIDLDTSINGISYAPGESYVVNGPVFAGGASSQAIANGFDVVTSTIDLPENVKLIQVRDIYHYYSIHLPSSSYPNSVFLIPAKRNSDYVANLQEFTSSSELDQVFSSSIPYSWRQDIKTWIGYMSNAMGPGIPQLAEGTEVLQKLVFSFIGIDTNVVSATGSFDVELKFNV